MKKILLTLFVLSFTKTALAADFVISIQSSGGLKKAAIYEGLTKIAQYVGDFGGAQYELVGGPYDGYMINGMVNGNINEGLRYRTKSSVGFNGAPNCLHDLSDCSDSCKFGYPGNVNLVPVKGIHRKGTNYYKTLDTSPVIVGTHTFNYIFNGSSCSPSNNTVSEYIESEKVLNSGFPKNAADISIKFE